MPLSLIASSDILVGPGIFSKYILTPIFLVACLSHIFFLVQLHGHASPLISSKMDSLDLYLALTHKLVSQYHITSNPWIILPASLKLVSRITSL
jgi:hypothetical protein